MHFLLPVPTSLVYCDVLGLKAFINWRGLYFFKKKSRQGSRFFFVLLHLLQDMTENLQLTPIKHKPVHYWLSTITAVNMPFRALSYKWKAYLEETEFMINELKVPLVTYSKLVSAERKIASIDTQTKPQELFITQLFSSRHNSKKGFVFLIAYTKFFL